MQLKAAMSKFTKFNRLQKLFDQLTKVQTELQEFFDLTPELLAILEPDGSFQVLSPNWEQTLGWSVTLLKFRCWTEFLHPDDLENSQSFLLSLVSQVSGSRGVSLENRFRCVDGSYRWLSWKILRGEEGELNAVAIDITHCVNRRKSAEVEREKLLACEQIARIKSEMAEQRFRSLVNNLTDGIVWECEPESLKFTFVSQSAERILGYSVEEWQSKPGFWVNLVHPDDREWVVAFCGKEVKQCRDHEFEYRCLSHDGRTVWLRDRVSLVRDNLGNVISLRGLMVDITARKLAEAERNCLLERERANNLAKDEFLAVVSHELRTPLTNIRMAIQLLKVATLPQKRDHYMQILLSECTREIKLVNNLLDLQRLEAEATILEWKPLQLKDWLPSIIKPFVEIAAAHQQMLRLDISPKLPVLISDLACLERVVVELLNNACKYTPSEGEITVKVYPLTSTTQPSSEAGVELVVSNSGIEIPPAELGRIFEKFYRVSHQESWQQGGTGLGLALVAKLIALLGGDIQATSQTNLVSFIVSLPLLHQQSAICEL